MKKFFTLIAAVALAASVNAQTAKVFTENTFLQTSQTNVQAGIAEGWIVAGSGKTAANGKKGSIDPQAKEEKGEGAVKLDGIGLKKDNEAKTFKMAITGVDNIEVYGVTTSSSDSRYVSVVATAADGTTVEKDEITAPGNTAVVKVQLEKAKIYSVEITGVKEDDKSAGADVALHGIWFNVGVTNGISNISAAAAKKNGKTYNMAGQEVSSSAKGIVIKNGKKYVK